MPEPVDDIDREEFTYRERCAIRRLRKVAETWPESLTLLSASGALEVVPTRDYRNDTLSTDRSASIFGIENDGGDPDWDINERAKP